MDHAASLRIHVLLARVMNTVKDKEDAPKKEYARERVSVIPHVMLMK